MSIPDRKRPGPRLYHATSFWTSEKTERLRVLWADANLSGSQIARMIGAKSSNAVIGRANRLHLPPRFDRMASVRKRVIADEERERRMIVLKAPRPPDMATPAPAEPPAAQIELEPDSLGLKIWELRENQCRYISGLPHKESAWSLTWCGHPTAPGSSWCSYHAKLCADMPTHRQEQRFKAAIKYATKNG
jgi:GcrA cell cycle regulator